VCRIRNISGLFEFPGKLLRVVVVQFLEAKGERPLPEMLNAIDPGMSSLKLIDEKSLMGDRIEIARVRQLTEIIKSSEPIGSKWKKMSSYQAEYFVRHRTVRKLRLQNCSLMRIKNNDSKKKAPFLV
jgi:hypothetical protein